MKNLHFNSSPFFFRELEHKLFTLKSFGITFYSLVECFCLYLIEPCKVEIEHHTLTADDVDEIAGPKRVNADDSRDLSP